MPIVFIHGVATRDDGTKYEDWWKELKLYLSNYIAPAVAPGNPSDVAILPAYWGDIGVSFAWNGASRPRSSILRMGTEPAPSPASQAQALAATPEAVRGAPLGPAARPGALGVVPMGPAAPQPGAGSSTLRLRDLSPDELSNLAATTARLAADEPGPRALATIAADEVARDPEARRQIAAQADREAEIGLLTRLIRERYARLERERTGVAGMGVPPWLTKISERLGEATSRVGSAPGFVLTRALAEFRKPANDLVTLFMGDVFRYIDQRGTAKEPGPIPRRVIDTLKAARKAVPANREPLVVLTHSMGGQILYDIVTSFLPNDPDGQGVRVDFWCATASQVGLFEEMKLFLNRDDPPRYGAQQHNRAPYPDPHYLGHWWNVWDPNDFISYTARPIFDGVDDESYDSGVSVFHAHSAYLERPSFFRRFAERIHAAGQRNWS